MRVAQIENGEVANVLLLSQPMLEQFRAATGFTLIPIPDDGDVIVGDLYNEEDKVFHRPEIVYDDEGGAKIVSLADMQREIDGLKQENTATMVALVEVYEMVLGGM